MSDFREGYFLWEPSRSLSAGPTAYLCGSGQIGMDSFAPNYSALHLSPVGPLNDQVVTIDSGRNMNSSPQVRKLIIAFQGRIV